MHPNQEPAVIAGQGTIALEVLEQVRETHGPARPWALHLSGRRMAKEVPEVPECSMPPSAQAPQVNAVVVPVGGGGMIAGIAVAIKVGSGSGGKRWLHLPEGWAAASPLRAPAGEVSGDGGQHSPAHTDTLDQPGGSCSPQALRPEVKVFAAEPRNADDCYQSKARGELTPNRHPPDTIADAVKTSIGPNTWPIIRDLVDDVLTVSEEEIKVNTPCSLLTVAASRQLPPSTLCPSALTPTLSQGSTSPCTLTAVQHPRCLQLERAGGSSALPSQRAAAMCTGSALHSPRAACACHGADSCCSVPPESHAAGVGKDEAAD